jgi:hypothetical protein
MKKRSEKLGTKGNLLFGLIAMLTLLSWATSCFAADFMVKWAPNSESDLAGYKVYYKAGDTFDSNGAVLAVDVTTISTTPTARINGLDASQSYSFAVTAYNKSGLESGFSNPVTINESVSPTVSITSPSTANVSGSVLIEAEASDENSGMSKVEFYINNSLVFTDNEAPYQFDWDTLAISTGAYAITAKAYDAAGNKAEASTSVNVVNDIAAPTVSITSPSNNSTISGSVKVESSASDDVAVSKVEFYANGEISAVVNFPPYSYNWNTANSTNGSVTLIAKAYDAKGNVGQSTVYVTVNNIATQPAPAPESAPAPDTAAPVVTVFTMPSTSTALNVAISSLTATDAIGVTGYLVSESSAVPAASANGWSSSAPTMYSFSSQGSKTLYAWAKDAAGNVSNSLSKTVIVTLPDTTAPVVGINQVTSPTTATSQTLSGSVTDNVGVASVTVQIGSATPYAASLNGNSWSFSLASLPIGTNEITVRATDASGNSALAKTSIVVETQPATLSIADATLAMQVSVGKIKPSTSQKSRLDVAPVINGKSSPNGKVDTGDAIVILSQVVGKIVL